jgi:4-hydroxybenzoate polyprenyltransferase
MSGVLVFQFLGIISIVLAIVYVAFMLRSLKTTDDELFRIYTYFPKINSVVGMVIFFAVLFN